MAPRGTYQPGLPLGAHPLDQLGAQLVRFHPTHRRTDRLREGARYQCVRGNGPARSQHSFAKSVRVERKQPWLDTLRADRDAGKIRYRIRILSHELTDYERYACEWGYALNAEAGEDIRVLRCGEHDIPARVIEKDFWVVDDNLAVVMHYDGHARFERAELLPSAELTLYCDARDVAWAAGEPFGEWWARHPELHRAVAA